MICNRSRRGNAYLAYLYLLFYDCSDPDLAFIPPSGIRLITIGTRTELRSY